MKFEIGDVVQRIWGIDPNSDEIFKLFCIKYKINPNAPLTISLIHDRVQEGREQRYLLLVARRIDEFDTYSFILFHEIEWGGSPFLYEKIQYNKKTIEDML